MRSITSQAEILIQLDQHSKLRSKFTLWQNDGTLRRTHDVFIDRIDKKIEQVYILPLHQVFQFEINEELPIYFYSDANSLVFQVDKYIKTGDEISFSFPIDVFAKEYRKVSREEIEYERKIFSNFKVGSNGVKKEFEFNIRNISKAGIGLTIDQKESKYFYEGDKLSFNKLDSKDLEFELSGTIKFIKKIEDSDKVHLGLEYESELNDSKFVEITTLIK